MAAGRVTTHVLDTARGCPAAGVPVALYALAADGGRRLLARAVTNADGRTDAPLLAAGLTAGMHELVFGAGDYLRGLGMTGMLFLDEVPVRFGVADAGAHHHVPLLLQPYGYSTYRGS